MTTLFLRAELMAAASSTGRSIRRACVNSRTRNTISVVGRAAAPVRCYAAGAGAGTGTVHDQMLPTSDATTKSQLFRHTPRPKTVSVIGAPMTYGQPYVGTDSGPMLLRDAGLLNDLTSLGWRVHDMADIDFDSVGKRGGAASAEEIPSAKHSLLVGNGCAHLADVVETELTKGRFPLVLGGDHSIGLGSLAGILRAAPRTGIIWVDAHADLNTPDMSESGNMHGMPIGILMEGLMDYHDEVPGLEWLAAETGAGAGAESESGSSKSTKPPPPRLNPDSVVYVGLRDVDRAERSVIRNLGIRAYTMSDIDHHGIGSVMDMALHHLLSKDPNRPIHLSYDIDAVDPIHAPATGTAVRGGLTYREAHYIAEAVAKSGALASAEIVELNPTLSDGDGSQETVELGRGLLTSLMGKSIL